MSAFHYHQHVLYCENVPLNVIAAECGTPCYVYSQKSIVGHIETLKSSLGNLSHFICYAIKANSNLTLLQRMAQTDCGFDAGSQGELLRALKVEANPKRIIYSGVGKTDDDIRAALAADVLYLSVESSEEISMIASIATAMQKQAAVCIRVNPDIDAQTHPYIATGLKDNKFGISSAEAIEMYTYFKNHPSLKPVGLSCHIGSQIVSLEPFVEAANHMATLAKQLQDAGIFIEYLGMGGGLGIAYQDETVINMATYGQALEKILSPLGLKIILEPGRAIMGDAGILLTRVVRRKKNHDRQFIIVDAGMNDFIRPALYQAAHAIVPVCLQPTLIHTYEKVDIVGPVCESADTFIKDYKIASVVTGDLLAISSCGAYGSVMGSTYNARLKPAEVLCNNDQFLVIRNRDRWDDLWRNEPLLAPTC